MRILLVEDDGALSAGIVLALGDAQYQFVQCESAAEAKRVLGEAAFDLVILDINLPDGSGLEVLSVVRQLGDVPVIILTANDLETDIVTGLELGADDYITKPFSLMVLRARVAAQLRRRGLAQAVVRIDDFVFDFEGMTYSKAGQPVELSKTEQKLLRLLVEGRGRTLSREALAERIWSGGGEYVDANALSVTVRRLRGKLEDTPSQPRYIKTVYGVGYTWAVRGD